jgi:hypothetical protein
MKPVLAVLAFGVLLGGCDNDCSNLNRMDGSWAVWQEVTNAPTSDAHTPLTISDGYPTQELFINGWTRWNLAYQASAKQLGIVMTDVLEPTDLPGEAKVFKSVSLTGTLTPDDSDCNVMDLAMSDLYDATVTDATGGTVSANTHTFTYAAHLVYYGDHIAGTFTYSDTYAPQGTDGSGTSTGQIDGVEGSLSAILKPSDAFDTGF